MSAETPQAAMNRAAQTAIDSIRRTMTLFPDADALVVDDMSGGAWAVSPYCSSTGVIYEGLSVVTSEDHVRASGVPLFVREPQIEDADERAERGIF